MATKHYSENSFLKVLVYGNIFISIAGLTQVLLTQILFDIEFDAHAFSYLAFILLSTFLQYNIQRGYNLILMLGGLRINIFNRTLQFGNPISINQVSNDRHKWLLINRKPMLLSILISLLTLFFLCNWLSWTSIYIMIGAELVSTLYYMKPFNLRRFGFIKPIIVGAIWVISCVLIPLLENKLLNEQTYYFIAAQFCFITALCVLFDVKDAEHDFYQGVKTYANAWGAKGARLVAFLFMLGYMVCFYMFDTTPITNYINLAFLTATSILIFFTHEERHPYYYYLLIDGLMILQLIITILSY